MSKNKGKTMYKTYKELKTREIKEILDISTSYASLIRNGHRNTSTYHDDILTAYIESKKLMPNFSKKLDSIESKIDKLLKE